MGRRDLVENNEEWDLGSGHWNRRCDVITHGSGMALKLALALAVALALLAFASGIRIWHWDSNRIDPPKFIRAGHSSRLPVLVMGLVALGIGLNGDAVIFGKMDELDSGWPV